MITIKNINVYGWETAIRGMRNPMNSWDKSDSGYGCYNKTGMCRSETPYLCKDCGFYRCEIMNTNFCIGENDLKLMHNLAKAGNDHGKFARMITVTMDITAPLYWWKEFDTYKIGTVANSCSTMHKIHSKEFTLDDFSHEHLFDETNEMDEYENPTIALSYIINILNHYRELFNKTKDKRYWWQMIQLLPSSYNQTRTVQFNYQVAYNMYNSRKNHKLDEWHELCDVIKNLPQFEDIYLK